MRVGIHEKLEVGFDFCELKAVERRIGLQHRDVLAGLRFEGDCRINARLAARHTHDLKNRFAVELVVQPVLIREKEIGHESQIEFTVGER